MPANTPLTMAELDACRDSIIECIGEMQTMADYAERELRTLKGALAHIEVLIKDFRSADPASKKSAASLLKKSAA